MARTRGPDDPYELSIEELRRAQFAALDRSDEVFDRIAFAMRALAVLSPTMRVAVYEGRSLEVDRGRPSGLRWAMVSIPKDASRAHIAFTLADLVGVAQEPWMIDTLLHLDAAPLGSGRRTPDDVPASQPS